MASHTIYVQSKNIDLDAMSAKEALIDYLGITDIVSVQRAKLWEVETPHQTESDPLNAIHHILKTSFYLANPNKETASLTNPFEKSDTTILLKVTSKHHENLTGLIAKIAAKTGITLTQCHSAVLWAIKVKPNSDIKTITAKIGKSTSPTNGLLSNAISDEITSL